MSGVESDQACYSCSHWVCLRDFFWSSLAPEHVAVPVDLTVKAKMRFVREPDMSEEILYFLLLLNPPAHVQPSLLVFSSVPVSTIEFYP